MCNTRHTERRRRLFSVLSDPGSPAGADRLAPREARQLATDAVDCFFERYRRDGGLSSEALTVLCRLAVDDDADIAKAGLRGIFPMLAERLSDAFRPDACRLYDLAFSQIIDFCRRHPAAGPVDRTLAGFGLNDAGRILARKNGLHRQTHGRPLHPDRLKKCFVLSRVSLGAEIAVTGPVIAKLREIFPTAEVILIGSPMMEQLFHGLTGFRVRPCPYPAGGNLLERMAAWLDALAIIAAETRGLQAAEFLVVDPDSRYTQLGLLPLVAGDDGYLFFESRTFVHPGLEKISALTSCWLKRHLGGNDQLPFIRLTNDARRYAAALRARLVPEKGTLAGVSFGVGGNSQKRLGPAFELALLKQLLAVDGNRILLFRGIGQQELAQSALLLDALARSGKQITLLSGDDIADLPPTGRATDIIAWEGPLREYCALVARTDVQIGYDSSSQHIAAACRVPAIDLFVDESTPMFWKRWAPHGRGPVGIVRTFEGSNAWTAPKKPVGTADMSLALGDLPLRHRMKAEKCLAEVARLFTDFLSRNGEHLPRRLAKIPPGGAAG